MSIATDEFYTSAPTTDYQERVFPTRAEAHDTEIPDQSSLKVQLAVKAVLAPVALMSLVGKTGGTIAYLGFRTFGKEVRLATCQKTVTAAAATLTTLGLIHGYDQVTEHDMVPAAFADACNDGGHQASVIGNTSKVDGLVSKDAFRGFVNKVTLGHVAQDDRTWADLARDLSGTTSPIGRGYTIPPESLAALNPELVQKGGDKLSPDIKLSGPTCLDLPSPIFLGIRLSNGKETASYIAFHSGLTMAQLEALNPGITDKDQIVEKGKIILTKKHVDTTLALRPYNGQDLSEFTKDPTQVKRINSANNLDEREAGVAYLPLVQTDTMKRGKITIDEEVKAFDHPAKRIKPDQTIGPKAEKSPIVSAPETSTMRDGADMLRMQLYGVPTKYAEMYLKYGRKYGVSPLLLAAMGSQESGWKQDPGVSLTGALGIAQFEPDTWAEWKQRLGFPDDASPMIPRYAIEAQAALMQSNMKDARAYVEQHGNQYSVTYVAESMYNGGVDGVNRKGVSAAQDGYASSIISMTKVMHNYLRPITLTNAEHPTSTGQIVPEKVRGKAYYSQTDLRWAYEPYNTGEADYNIGGYGCTPTSQAIIMTTFTGRLFNPVDMARFNMANGYIAPDSTGGGTDGEAAAYGMARSFDFEAKGFDPKDGLTTEMKDFLDAGGLIMINGQTPVANPNIPATTGAHVYVIDGYTEDNKLTILNPDSIEQTNKTWDPADIFPYSSYAVGIKKK